MNPAGHHFARAAWVYDSVHESNIAMSGDFNNILVMRGGALGDFVLTLPVLAALRQRFSAARLEVLGYPRIAELARAGGWADGVGSIEAPELAGWFVAEAGVTDRFAKFDLIVSYVFDPEMVFEGNVKRSAPKAVFLRGRHRLDETLNMHATEQLLEPLKELGITSAETEPRLELSNQPMNGDWVAMHPGSGSEKKNWPEERWAKLLAAVMERTKRRCLLVGGEAEGDRLERLQKLIGARKERVELAKDLPLVELAKRLQGCGGFLGHDSGVTHLAAAVGLPGLVLWGETNEAVWRPRNEKMEIIRSECGLSRLPVEDVFGKLTALGIV
jgi:heptosyltransferase-2